MTERGAAGIVLLAVGLLAVLSAVLVVDVARLLAARASIATAADAAALAAAPVTFRPFGAAGGPRDEAARFAAANGARLVTCRCPVDETWGARSVDVVVEARVRLFVFGAVTVRASSRAEFVPTRLDRAAAANETPGQEGWTVIWRRSSPLDGMKRFDTMLKKTNESIWSRRPEPRLTA